MLAFVLHVIHLSLVHNAQIINVWAIYVKNFIGAWLSQAHACI